MRIAGAISAAYLAVLGAFAYEIPLDDAVFAAARWAGNGANLHGANLSAEPSEARTVRAGDGTAIYHVVSMEGGGYMILSAENRITPVIAFSDNGEFVESDENPLYSLLAGDMPLRLEMVENAGERNAGGRTLAAAGAAETEAFPGAQAEWDSLLSRGRTLAAVTGLDSVPDTRVAPLLKTKWGQSTVWDKTDRESKTFYNYYTPNNYVCGCVATATAQIMKYHRHPTASIEARTFECAVDGVWTNLTTKAGMFSWDAMPLVPKNLSTITVAQREAVGKLMYNVGVACEMSYKSGGSGSSLATACKSLKSLFGYESAFFIYVDNTGKYDGKFPDWELALENGILANLDYRKPVGLSISSTAGSLSGHAVVADGYGYSSASTLYVHVNMGWSGSNDAWYALPEIYEYDRVRAISYNIFPDEQGEIVSGRTLDDYDNPIAGAVVKALDPKGVEAAVATSDAKGLYALLVPSSAGYTIKAETDLKSGTTHVDVGTSLGQSFDGVYSLDPTIYTIGNRWGEDIYLSGKDGMHVVDFYPNGGAISGNPTLQMASLAFWGEEPQALLKNEYVREGYQFAGWALTSDGDVAYADEAVISVTGDLILYAKWVRIGFPVVYKPGANGTGQEESDVKAFGEDLQLKGAIFTRTGYRQTGWSTTDGGSLAYTLSSYYTANAALTLYPFWRAETYKVTLDRQGATSGTASVTATYGSSMPSITRPTRTGFEFGGYFSGENGTGVKYYNADGTSARAWDVAGAATLYAKWNPVAYTVTLDRQSGSGGTASVAVPYNDPMPEIEIPERDGYSFDGYFSGKKGAGTKYYNADGTSAHTWDRTRAATIYAKWTAKSYKVTLDPEGGSGGTETVDATYASAMPAMTRPVRAGYEFGGYFSGRNGSGARYYNGDGTSARAWDLAGEATLYAHWRAFDLTCGEPSVYEGDDLEITVFGGSANSASSVKLYIAYETATVADLDLAKGRVDGVAPKGGLKFPLTLEWAAGDSGVKTVAIPVKADKTVEADETLLLQIGDPLGLQLGEMRDCIVTINDAGYDDLAAKIAAGDATKAEETSWNKLKRNGVFIRGIADPASAGKVTGSAWCPDGKKVSLKATANKGYVFTGWTVGAPVEPGDAPGVDYLATTAGLTVDRSAKPAKSSATATVITDVDENATYFANYVTTEEDKAAIGLEIATPAETGTGSTWTGLDEGTVPNWSVMCGVATDWPLATSGLSAITVKATGLPAGLKLVQDKETKAYSISGIPTTASKKNAKTGEITPSKVKLTATSAGKSSKVYNMEVTVLPLYDWAQGTFTGYVWDGSNGPLAGAVQSFTVTAAGKISGKVQRGATAYTLTGNGFEGLDGKTDLIATVVEKAGKAVTTNTVTVSESEIALEDGTLLGVAEGAAWIAYQNLWKGTALKPVAAKMAKAPILTLSGTADGLPTDGDTLTVKVAATGVATVKGTFVTGVNARTGKPVTATASTTAPLIPAGADTYSLFIHLPPKGTFPGYPAELSLTWDGSEFKVK